MQPTSQPPPSVSMSQNTSKGRSRLPLRKMVVVFEVLGPFCISSPQSRGKGTRSPPVEKRWGVCLSPSLRPQPPAYAQAQCQSVPVVKEVDTGGVRLSPQTARSWAL